MTSKTFVTGTTIDSAWLNDVNSATYSGGAVYTPGGTGSVPTTVQTKLRENVSLKDFGSTENGIASDQTAFVNAIASGANQITINGTCYLTADVTVPSTCALNFNYGAKIKMAYGKNLTVLSTIAYVSNDFFIGA